MQAKSFAQLVVCVCIVALVVADSLGESLASSSPPGDPARVDPIILQAEDTYLPVSLKSSESSDCGVIQSAIDALPPTGGQILLSSGTFTCTTAIVIERDQVDLRGQGASTILSLANAANSPVIVVGQVVTPPSVTHRHIRIADLSIQGNRERQTQECWGGPCDTGGLTFIRNNGITLRRVSDVQIEHVSVEGAISGGLVTEKGSQRITVQDFSSANNQFDGLAAYETEDSVFSGLYLHDNLFAGLSLDIHFNHNIISQAVIVNNGRQGVFMRDSRDNVFSAIQIRGSGEQGVFLAQVDADATKPAAGNTFSGLNVSGSGQAGLRVNNASCINNLVIGAQFSANQACISEAIPGLVQQVGVVCRE